MLADRTPCSQLAALRQAKGITLEDISSSTRIGRHFLEAIEAEEFKKLPGGVYNVNYLRQYARISGCDEQALLRRYHDQVDVHPAPEPPNRIPRYLEPLRSVFGRLSDGRADGRADSRSDRRAARNHA